jgi:hypothetical protein
MASKKDFLEYPATDICTTVLSMGPPRSGKTYLMLQCVKAWIEMGMFERYVMVLPSFKNEADGSYDWLLQYDEYVDIYESYHDHIGEAIIAQQEKNNELHKAGKLQERPRIFFCIDDATGQGTKLFKSESLLKIVTQNRHIFIHSWLLLHYDKGVVTPKMRNNILWVVLYPVKKKLLEQAFDSYINFPEFDDFKQDFKPFWDKNVRQKKHGCLLIKDKEKYTTSACDWFNENESKQNISTTNISNDKQGKETGV